MVGGNIHLYPILPLVNYWQWPLSSMELQLAPLVEQKMSQIATFIPWQVAESEVLHPQLLTRFLQAAAERQMQIFLILTPELGVAYLNSGLPKDLMALKENRAKHSDAGEVWSFLPPNLFGLPSVFSSEFHKRYYNFMGRLDGLLSDLVDSHPQVMQQVFAVLSGSFWKYYQSPKACFKKPWGGMAGDYSPHANQVFRRRVEQYFAQSEFMDVHSSAVPLWKLRSLEPINRRWFYQQAEDIFRSRTYQVFRRRSSKLKILEMEIFTPEADAHSLYSNFLQMLSQLPPDCSRFASFLDEAAVRGSVGGASLASPWIHWTLMGGFQLLSDPEKQLLLLKSLILLGGLQGGCLVDEGLWRNFSHEFQTRVFSLASWLKNHQFQIKNKIFYLAPHLWSQLGPLFSELFKKIQPEMRLITSLDWISRDQNASTLVVDPDVILTEDKIQKLMAWAQAGRMVVLPKNSFYTDFASKELFKVLEKTKSIAVQMEASYQLHDLGQGYCILYSVPVHQDSTSWQALVQAILSLGELAPEFQLDDQELSVFHLENTKKELILFVFNPNQRKKNTLLTFSTEVNLKDLSSVLTPDQSVQAPWKSTVSRQFSIEVPPFGVISLWFEKMSKNQKKDQYLASLIAEDLKKNADQVAQGELQGLYHSVGLGDLWS